MKWANFGLKAGLAVILLVAASYELGYFRVAQLSARVDELESEKKRLLSLIERFQSSRRVGQIDIVKQYKDMLGRTISVLLWQEVAADGSFGRPFALEVIGQQVYVEGQIIKFDYERLERSQGEEGASLVLFRRLFGDQQPPVSGVELDRVLRPSSETTSSEAETTRLWERFWELTTQPKLAKEYGVRVAQCEAPSVRVAPGQVWEVTLETTGGLNLRLLGMRPEGLLAGPHP